MILMARTFVSMPVGIATILLGVATAVLLLILASSPPSGHQVLYVLPLVAAIVQIFACCVRIILMFLKYRHDKKMSSKPVVEQTARSHAVLLTLRILLSLAAAAVVASALGWAEKKFPSKKLLVVGIAVPTFLTITWIVWGISILADVLYYISIIWVHKNTLKISEQRFSIDDAPREMIEPSRLATGTTIQSNPFHEQLLSSPPSLIASDGTASLRSSFSTLPRPSSSRRGVLIRQNSYTRQSGRSSWDSPSGRQSQDEALDSWDTSAVSSQIRETVLKPMKGSGLEPIPGSRSPSPAKALEGPFFQSSPSLTPPPSPLPQPSISCPNSPPSSPLEFPNFAAMFPPPSTPPSPTLQHSFPRPSTRSGPVSRSRTVSRSRPGSRSRAPSSEDNIHPLFRTSSPTPPPSASAGTNVTAAPEAGQLISERMLKRMRSGSLPSSPSPLVRSESSPDIRTIKVPPSPSLGTMPPSPTVGARPDQGHRRKRSASFSQLVRNE